MITSNNDIKSIKSNILFSVYAPSIKSFIKFRNFEYPWGTFESIYFKK